MASSVSKDAAIFRFTNPGNSEGTIPDSEAVGMDYGIDESTDIGIISFKPIGDKRRTDVGNPFQSSSTKPDTGIAVTQYQLDMIVSEKLADSSAVAKFFKFYFDENSIRGLFRGRIGIRLDKFQGGSFDIIPNSVAGFKIIHVEAQDDLVWGGFIPVSITLEFIGNPIGLVIALTNYINLTG